MEVSKKTYYRMMQEDKKDKLSKGILFERICIKF